MCRNHSESHSFTDQKRQNQQENAPNRAAPQIKSSESTGGDLDYTHSLIKRSYRQKKKCTLQNRS